MRKLLQDWKSTLWRYGRWDSRRTNVQVGDLVYIYVGKHFGQIKYLCKVNKVNLSEIINDDTRFTIDGSGFMNHRRYMQLELINIFDEELLSYRYLKENGLGRVQGPSRVDERLEKYISSVIKRIKIPYDKDLFLETIRDYIKSWCLMNQQVHLILS